jgi:hypothetical protein
MLNRRNELKDLLKTQGLACFGTKNELKTNSLLSAKSANNGEQGTGNREQSRYLAPPAASPRWGEAEPAVPSAGAPSGDKMSLGASKK